jgi:hypothetical protein
MGGNLKFAIGLIGLSIALLILIWGFVIKDNGKIKRAAMIFVGTWIALLLIGLIEFLIAD